MCVCMFALFALISGATPVPVIQIKGKFTISIKHLLRDFYRYGYCKILTNEELGYSSKTTTKTAVVKFTFRLPKIFWLWNWNKTKDEVMKLVQKDFRSESL